MTRTRRSWLDTIVGKVLFVAVAAGLALGATVLADRLIDDEPSSASISAGLTTVASWPRYQSELDAFLNIATSETMIDSIRVEGDFSSLEVDTVYVDGQFVVDLVVTAEDPDASVQAADLLARRSIEEHTRRVVAADAQELELVESELADLELEVEALAAAEQSARRSLIELGGNLDADYSFEGEALYREAAAATSVVEGDWLRARSRAGGLQVRADDLRLALDSPSTIIYIVDDASIESRTAPFEGAVPAVVAGVLAGLGAIAWLISRSRLRGVVRRADALERLVSVPVIADSRDDPETVAPRLAGALARAEQHGPLLLVPAPGVDVSAVEIRDGLIDGRGGVGESSRALLMVEPTDRAGSAVVVAKRGSTTLPAVQETIDLQQIRGRDVRGVVII